MTRPARRRGAGDITRRHLLAAAGAGAAGVGGGAQGAQATPRLPSTDQTLWFTAPAQRWADALPIGNGRLGAMVFGGIEAERLALNEETLWSGQPQDGDDPRAAALLPQVREAVFAGDYVGADALSRRMQGPFSHSFAPLADLRLSFEGAGEADDYRRALDLDAASATVEYRIGRARYRREAFASRPDGLIVLRLTTDAPAGLTFSMRLDTVLRGAIHAHAQRLTLIGKAPTVCEPSYREVAEPVRYSDAPGEGMVFATLADLAVNGGVVRAQGEALRVEGAREAVIRIAAATGFRGYDRAPDLSAAEVEARAARALSEAEARGFSALRAAHRRDHRSLYRRVGLTLGDPAAAGAAQPTDVRQAAPAQGADPALAALYFNLGRYLLIACSRPGGQAANLQGMWNAQVRPPWSSNYTTNINVQMNYWPAQVCNLPELSLPLLDLIADLAERGRRTARVHYGLDGWCVHHNTDLWRLTSPVGGGTGDPTWANFALAGPWLAQHVWEHFRYGRDTAFLARRGYPILKGCAEFCAGWLARDPRDGRMTPVPSVSTENLFRTRDGALAQVSAGCALDLAMIRELFTNTVEAARLLGVDAAFADRLAALAQDLPPYRIGRHGQLQEWEVDFEEPYPGQRHLSPLYGVYPGDAITPRRDPGLAQAAAVSLERREAQAEGDVGWSIAWAAAIWARLGDSARAQAALDRLLARNVGPNLLATNGGPQGDFQIDANFGGTAAAAEILLQSHEDAIALLPALPPAWSQGAFTGLRARGGAVVDARWAHGRLVDAAVTPATSGPVTLRLPQGASLVAIRCAGRDTAFTVDGAHIRADLTAGRRHGLVFA